MHASITSAPSVDAQREALRGIQTSDGPLRGAIREALSAPKDQFASKYARVKSMLDLRLVAIDGRQPANAAEQIRRIKSAPFYRDPGVKSNSNWIEEALKNLPNLFKRKPSEDTEPIEVQPKSSLTWLIYVVIGILCLAIAAFLGFAISQIRIKNSRKRAARAVLDDDEPDRSLDEWLALADQLVADGRYREAVRCLYLACLLRFDEARVARFERGETNWEHLARIQASRRKPAALDFTPMTRAFDRIWYGMNVRGIEDVDQFRHWYREITVMLSEAAA